MSKAVVNKKSGIIVTTVKEMRDYSKDPFFRKKAEKANAFLKKHGLPETRKK